MIKNFLVINCIGKNDKIALKIDNNFFTYDFNSKTKNNDQLVSSILNLVKKHKVKKHIVKKYIVKKHKVKKQKHKSVPHLLNQLMYLIYLKEKNSKRKM